MSKFGTLQLCYTSSLYIITKKYVGTMLTMRAVCSVMNIKMGEKLKKKTWINVKKNMQITGVWKWCEPYPMAFTVTRSPLQWTYVRFWSDLLDSALHHQHQNNKITKAGISFGRVLFIPLVVLQELVQYLPQSTETVLKACGGQTVLHICILWKQ